MRTRDILKELRHEKYVVNYEHSRKLAEVKAELFDNPSRTPQSWNYIISQVAKGQDDYVIALHDLIAYIAIMDKGE